MSDTRTHAIVLLYWGMLAAGAGLSGFGLSRSLVRHRDRTLAGLDDEGEIVIGDGRLQSGQTVIVAPGDRTLAADPSGVITGQLESISRKHCVLLLDPETTPRALSVADPEAGSGRGRAHVIERGTWPAIGAAVTVTVTAASELYRFTARIRDVRSAGEGARLYVSRPGTLARIQRRRHARVGLSVPATFERVCAPESVSTSSAAGVLRMSAPLHGTVRDISGGGIRAQIGGVLSLHELDVLLGIFQPETTVRIGLPFPALTRNSVLARIRSSCRAATPGGLTLQVACEFLPMPTWEQEIVIQHAFQFQREHLRNEKMRRHGNQPGVPQ